MEGLEREGDVFPGCLSSQHGSSGWQTGIPACVRCGCDGEVHRGQSQLRGCEQAGCWAVRAGLSLSASLLGPAQQRRRQARLSCCLGFPFPSLPSTGLPVVPPPGAERCPWQMRQRAAPHGLKPGN